MKTIISTILFLIITNSCFAQKYPFDILVRSNISTEYSDRDDAFLFNSKDYSYYLKIYSQNDTLKSWIIDRKRKRVHFFYIKDKDPAKFDLKFLGTNNFNIKPLKNTYEFSGIKSKENDKEIDLNIKNENGENVASYNLSIEETEKNFFPLFYLTGAIEPFQLLTIKPPSNFLVKEAKGINIDGNKVKYTFNSIKEIDVYVIKPLRIQKK